MTHRNWYCQFNEDRKKRAVSIQSLTMLPALLVPWPVEQATLGGLFESLVDIVGQPEPHILIGNGGSGTGGGTGVSE